MAHHNMLLVSLCLVVLFVEPYRVYGSSRGPNTAVDGSEVYAPDRLCASWISPQGYKCQEFQVKTTDGYILSVQRIPEGRSGRGRDGGGKKQPVLMQHGVLVDGMTWLLNSPDESLAFILADSGFDVWIANTRGTRFSLQHTTLNYRQQEYWDWTWDDLADHDLPATFDFVYAQTGQKVHYVGHSLGTLVALASFSQGKLVDRLKSAALLSPVAYLSHMTTGIGILAAKAFVGELTTMFGFPEFNPKGPEVAIFLKALCAHPGVNCYDLMTAITGKNCCLNGSTVELFLRNEPQSTSTKNMVHLAQTVRQGALTKFNYGRASLNLERYGQSKPPVYNLSNIPNNLPLFLSYGGRDALADVGDVGTLLDSLKLHDGDKLTVQFVKDYAHADFIMGVSAKSIVYNAVVAFFRRW